MISGRLDRYITILRATVAPNAMNEDVLVWGPIARIAASAVPVKDGEKETIGQTLASKTVRFSIRYSSTVADVDPRDRVQFDGRIYDINGVKEIGRREGLEITATARAETP